MNRAELAVAGGRKTQSIVDSCVESSESHRILVLGYTIASQSELESRIRNAGVFDRRVEVMGWFAFLMHHFVQPYLPLLYRNRKLAGLNFDGDPGRYAKGERRFLDNSDRAYKLHLSKLAHDVSEASYGSVLDRIEHIYDEIFIDEVQDLGGWDLEILEMLLRSSLKITMVGDMRQAVLSTNVRDPKNSPYRREGIFDWFKKMEHKGLLEVVQKPVTYRSIQAIATLSDSIFSASKGYAATVSAATHEDPHMGLFIVQKADALAYFRKFNPLCLRHSRAVAKGIELPFLTFGTAKGS